MLHQEFKLSYLKVFIYFYCQLEMNGTHFEISGIGKIRLGVLIFHNHFYKTG